MVEAIAQALQQAKANSFEAVPLVWIHYRNWVFACKFLPSSLHALREEILEDLLLGVKLHFQGDPQLLPQTARNLIFLEYEELLTDCDFVEELDRGRMVKVAHWQVQGAVRLLTVPKDDDKIRLCRDCTDKGDGLQSLNSEVPDCFKWVQFDRFTDVVQRAFDAGPNGVGFCLDGDAFYRQFALRRDESPWMCYLWRGDWYMDRRCPFGPAGAPRSHQNFSAAIAIIAPRWFLPQREDLWKLLKSYIDDFYTFAKNRRDGWLLAWALLSALWFLGVHASAKKFFRPAPVIKVLGFIFDLPRQCVHIPQDKIEKAKWRLRQVLLPTHTSRKQMERTLELLQWVAQVAFPLRAMLRSSYAELVWFPRDPHALFRLAREAREQLQWWMATIDQLNSRPFSHILGHSEKATIVVTSDAAGLGVGFWWDRNYVQYTWDGMPPPWNQLRFADINLQEMFALVMAVQVLGDELNHRYVKFVTDNATVYWAMFKLTSDHETVMASVRMVARQAIHRCFRWFSAWLSTKDNKLADALSRGQWLRVYSLFDHQRWVRQYCDFDVITEWLFEEPAWERILRA